MATQKQNSTVFSKQNKSKQEIAKLKIKTTNCKLMTRRTQLKTEQFVQGFKIKTRKMGFCAFRSKEKSRTLGVNGNNKQAIDF